MCNATLLAAYATVGVRVYEVGYLEWVDSFVGKPAKEFNGGLKFYGLYYNRTNNPNYPKRFIVINSAFPNFAKFFTLWHEKGHDLCVISGCYCADKTALMEAHANIYALRQCLAAKERASVLLGMQRIEKTSRLHPDKGYRQGAKKVMRDDVWNDAIDFIGAK
jgi:hypothetical protein